MNTTQLHTERELLLRTANGDEQAFKHLFHHYLPLLRPFIIRLAGSESGAQDILQNTFVRIWLSRDKLPQLENPKAWIYKLASNECYTWLKKEAALAQRQKRASPREEPLTPTSGQLELKEVQTLIDQAVDNLSPRRRQIYLLSRNHDQKISEIAAELNLSESYVKNSIVDSLNAIRSYLAHHGYQTSLLVLLFMSEKNFF